MAEYQQVGNQLIPIPPLTNPCRPAGTSAAAPAGEGIPIVPLAVTGGVVALLVSLLS